MNVADVIARRAFEHVKSGLDPNQAADLACQEYYSMAGLGQDTPASQSVVSTIASDVKAVGADISPYLWILSIVGFIMGVVNKAEISRMYGSWKRAKQKLLR